MAKLFARNGWRNGKKQLLSSAGFCLLEKQHHLPSPGSLHCISLCEFNCLLLEFLGGGCVLSKTYFFTKRQRLDNLKNGQKGKFFSLVYNSYRRYGLKYFLQELNKTAYTVHVKGFAVRYKLIALDFCLLESIFLWVSIPFCMYNHRITNKLLSLAVDLQNQKRKLKVRQGYAITAITYL